MDVFLLISDSAGRLLFGLRAEHLYAGGQWNLVSGKADEGEDVISAAIREAAEEAALTLSADDLRPIGVAHVRPAGGQARVGFGFAVDYDPARHGEVRNGEPHKCDGLRWAAPERPPEPLEEYNSVVLGLLTRRSVVVVHGWGPPPIPGEGDSGGVSQASGG